MRSGKDFPMETFEEAAEVPHAGLEIELAAIVMIEALRFIKASGESFRKSESLQITPDSVFIVAYFQVQAFQKRTLEVEIASFSAFLQQATGAFGEFKEQLRQLHRLACPRFGDGCPSSLLVFLNRANLKVVGVGFELPILRVRKDSEVQRNHEIGRAS